MSKIHARPKTVDRIAGELEEVIRAMITSRASRLSRLVSLRAPDFIVAIEFRMLSDAVLGLLKSRGYDPETDDRLDPYPETDDPLDPLEGE